MWEKFPSLTRLSKFSITQKQVRATALEPVETFHTACNSLGMGRGLKAPTPRAGPLPGETTPAASPNSSRCFHNCCTTVERISTTPSVYTGALTSHRFKKWTFCEWRALHFAVSLAVYQIYLLPSFFPEDKVKPRGRRVITQTSFPLFRDFWLSLVPMCSDVWVSHTRCSAASGPYRLCWLKSVFQSWIHFC